MLINLLIWAVLAIAMLILLRRPKDKPKESRSKIDSPFADEARHAKWYDLKKLEYERAADRYDNIYKAVWQNFSYMAVLAAGILTFGSKSFDGAHPSPLVALALTPLVFWFLATFLPLDHYGNETRERLKDIEEEINDIYFPKPNDPKLKHFILFGETKHRLKETKQWRVQDAVWVAGRLITAGWLLAIVIAIHNAIG